VQDDGNRTEKQEELQRRPGMPPAEEAPDDWPPKNV
jgi:hypothetical protein